MLTTLLDRYQPRIRSAVVELIRGYNPSLHQQTAGGFDPRGVPV